MPGTGSPATTSAGWGARAHRTSWVLLMSARLHGVRGARRRLGALSPPDGGHRPLPNARDPHNMPAPSRRTRPGGLCRAPTPRTSRARRAGVRAARRSSMQSGLSPTHRRWDTAPTLSGSRFTRGLAAGSSTTMRAASSLIGACLDGKPRPHARRRARQHQRTMVTNTGSLGSSFYWENKQPSCPKKSRFPSPVSVLPDDLCPAPRSWAEKGTPSSLPTTNRLPKAGTRPAWEQTRLCGRGRAGFQSLRK